MTSSDDLRQIGPTSCPPASRRLHSPSAVEKIDGGVSVWGITIGSNCQIALPVFGTLFLVIGLVLTVISYGWVTGGGGGEDDLKRKLYTTDNGRLLGPICLIVSVVMFVATAVLRTLNTNARFRQTRVGFHCPVHGDFFPLSPGPDPRKFSFSTENIAGSPWICNCLDLLKADSQETLAVEDMPPQCPHNGSHSNFTRSPSPQSNCPTPKPFLIFTDASHGTCKELYSGNTLFPDEPFGTIRSLSLPTDNMAVACFPVQRPAESYLNVPEDPWSHKRLSCPSLPSSGDEFPEPVHKPLTPQVVKVTREIKFVLPIEKNS